MATGFNTQVGDGQYSLQFSTDNREFYQAMQALARICVDCADEAWEDSREEAQKGKTHEVTVVHTIELTHILKGVPDRDLPGQLDHLKYEAPGLVEERLRENFKFLDDVKTANMQVFVREETEAD